MSYVKEKFLRVAEADIVFFIHRERLTVVPSALQQVEFNVRLCNLRCFASIQPPHLQNPGPMMANMPML